MHMYENISLTERYYFTSIFSVHYCALRVRHVCITVLKNYCMTNLKFLHQ